jgi:hypothetical protein
MVFGPSNYILVRNKYLWIVTCLGECLFGSDAIVETVESYVAPTSNTVGGL